MTFTTIGGSVSNAPQELPFNELILIPKAAAGVV